MESLRPPSSTYVLSAPYYFQLLLHAGTCRHMPKLKLKLNYYSDAEELLQMTIPTGGGGSRQHAKV